MNRFFNGLLFGIPALWLAVAAPAHAGTIVLTGATAFNANSDGSANGGGITATGTCCQQIFVELDAFTGASTDNLSGGGITLTPGAHTLYFESADWTAGFGVTHGGINLFFDGLSTPGISIYLPTSGDKSIAATWSVIGSGLGTLDLSNGTVLSSASSTYANAFGDSVSINAGTVNWVGGNGVNPYNASETVQRLDITVAGGSGVATPEPAAALLVLPGLVFVALRRRAARQSGN